MEGPASGPPAYLDWNQSQRKDWQEDHNDLVILRKPVPGLSEAALAKFVSRARRATRLQGSIDVLITSSREVQTLNYRFRGKNKSTDVLSFPAMPDLANDFAGDVAISAEIATKNARLLGHTAAQEIKILTLHGVLHLAGHDHEHDRGEMARKEEGLRRSLGLPQGLIDRSDRASRTNPRSRKKRFSTTAKANVSRPKRVTR